MKISLGPYRVSPICMGVSDLATRADESTRRRMMEIFLEAEGNFFDSAHCYAFWAPNGLGSSERELGRMLREMRVEDAVVATKGGHIGMDGYPRPDAFMSPEMVAQDLSESLDRLGRPKVELYYLHRDDPRMPVGELLDHMESLKSAGLIGAYAASNWSQPRLQEASDYAKAKGISGFAALQNCWSLARPNWENKDVPGAVRHLEPATARAAAELGLVLAPYSSNANGFFATKGGHGKSFDNPDSRAKLERVCMVARRHGCTPGQVALAYLACQPFPVVPVIGTMVPDHLEENLGALSIRLSEDELIELDGD